MSGRWLCVSPQGEQLSWTSSDAPVTVEECKGMCYSQCLGGTSYIFFTFYIV